MMTLMSPVQEKLLATTCELPPITPISFLNQVFKKHYSNVLTIGFYV